MLISVTNYFKNKIYPVYSIVRTAVLYVLARYCPYSTDEERKNKSKVLSDPSR